MAQIIKVMRSFVRRVPNKYNKVVPASPHIRLFRVDEKSLRTFLSKILNQFILKVVRFAKEPPIRLVVKKCVRICPASIRTKADWDAVDRPHYLIGILAAADQAVVDSVPAISVIEFGVGSGEGLLAMEQYSVDVERETGVRVNVYGFDTGKGLPETYGEFRDHPDYWKAGDHPMDEQSLRQRLSSRTRLVIGDVAETVGQFVYTSQSSPIGFIAFDLDLYSSTRDALKIFLLPGRRVLRRVTIYFDDIDLVANHRFAGALLAINEFNKVSDSVKIDRWRGIGNQRAFFESPWLKKMYMAHDLEAISRVRLVGPAAHV